MIVKALECVVNVKVSEYDLYIGRANRTHNLPASKWQNPYAISKDCDRASAISQYKDYLLGDPELLAALPELKGKVLGCWCAKKHDRLTADDEIVCHGQILLKALRGDYAIAHPQPSLNVSASPEEALYLWFLTEFQPPSEPFNLKPWQRVADPERWYAVLRSEVEQSLKFLDGAEPKPSPRQYTGGLQAELENLRAWQ